MTDDKVQPKIKEQPTLDEAIFWIIIITMFAALIRYFELYRFYNAVQLLIVFIALIIFKFRAKNLKKLGFQLSKRAVKLTLVYIFVLGIFYGLLFAVMMIFFRDEMTFVSTDFQAVFQMIIVAPIFEEIFFRGFLYNALRKNFGFAFSLIFSAMLFMMMHQVWGIIGLENINHFFGGLVFAFAFEKTKSIYAPILLHSLGNSSLVIIALIFSTNPF